MTLMQDVRIIDFEATPADIKFSKTDAPIVLDNSFVSDISIGGFTFTLYTPPVIPAGAVYPIPHDVLSGVVYGPTGADYTGLTVLPAPADVKMGVQYGAPREYVGTYNPAGGTYPPESDTELGNNYGPTGTEYAGNLTLPAIADVKLGVQYGANGTEFTGTLEGGGGGKHRVRSVM